MPKPRKTLDAALGRVGEEPAAATSTLEAAVTQNAPPIKISAPPTERRKGRVAPKATVYMSEATHRQLREIAHVEYPTKLNDLFLEGIDRVFKDRGRPSIAELDQTEK